MLKVTILNFEVDRQQIIKTLDFKQFLKHFSNKILIFVNQLRNILEIEQEEYKKLLKENINNKYKNSNLTKLYNINQNANKITILDRIE